LSSFPGDAKHRTRNLEIPVLVLTIRNDAGGVFSVIARSVSDEAIHA
jgi:hypothetical protein